MRKRRKQRRKKEKQSRRIHTYPPQNCIHFPRGGQIFIFTESIIESTLSLSLTSVKFLSFSEKIKFFEKDA